VAGPPPCLVQGPRGLARPQSAFTDLRRGRTGRPLGVSTSRG